MIGRSGSPWPGVGRQAGDCLVVCTVTLFCVHSDMIVEWSCLHLHHNCRVVFFLYNFIYLFLVVLGLCCCAGFSLVVASGGKSLVVVHGRLIVVASLVAEHGL